MQLVWIIVPVCLISLVLMLRKKIRRPVLKPSAEKGPSRDWQVKGIVNDMFFEKETYFLSEQVKKIEDFEIEAARVFAEMRTVMEEGTKACDEWNAESKKMAVSASAFDIFGAEESFRKKVIDVTTRMEKFELKIVETSLMARVSMGRISLMFESLDFLKPELLADRSFGEQVKRAAEADIAWVEERGKNKLSEFDRLGFCFVEDFLKRISIPELNALFMPRLKALST